MILDGRLPNGVGLVRFMETGQVGEGTESASSRLELGVRECQLLFSIRSRSDVAGNGMVGLGAVLGGAEGAGNVPR